MRPRRPPPLRAPRGRSATRWHRDAQAAAARRGGAILIRHLNKLDKIKVEKKGHNDFVSDADRAAIAAYLKAVPPHPNGYPARKSAG